MIPIRDIDQHFTFFLPWAGMEKAQYVAEAHADVKAAERMGKLFDELLAANPGLLERPNGRHALNVFFTRLLFCFFAEDTGIFAENQFTNAVGSHTQADGSDVADFLTDLFTALDTEDPATSRSHLSAFPYVNGRLFTDGAEHTVPSVHQEGPRPADRVRDVDLARDQPRHLRVDVPGGRQPRRAQRPRPALHLGAEHPQDHRAAVPRRAQGEFDAGFDSVDESSKRCWSGSARSRCSTLPVGPATSSSSPTRSCASSSTRSWSASPSSTRSTRCCSPSRRSTSRTSTASSSTTSPSRSRSCRCGSPSTR